MKRNKLQTMSLGSIVRPRREKEKPADHPDLSFIGLEHIESHTTKLLGSVPATEMRSTAHCFRPGDVLFSRLRPYLNKVWRADRKGLCSSEFIVLPENNLVDGDFLRYRLSSPDFVAFASHLNTGDRPRVDFGQISVFQIFLPKTLEEQRQIVAEIEKQFTGLEAGVAALKRVQANLKRYRAAVLKAACEGRLVPTEADLSRQEGRAYETGDQLLIRILKRRREVFDVEKSMGSPKKYKEPSEIEPGLLPFIPEGWTLASAEAVCSSVRDGTHDTPAYVSDGLPLITSKNLLPCGLDFDNVKLVSRTGYDEIAKRSGVERGDILFAMIGTIGNPVVVETDREFSIKNVGLFKANIDFILPRYLRYWFMSPTFTRWLDPKQKGTTQKFVPLGLLRALVVALPPLAEQKRIVAEVERRLSVIEEQEAMVSASLQRAARLRQSILQRAFSGGLVYNGT